MAEMCNNFKKVVLAINKDKMVKGESIWLKRNNVSYVKWMGTKVVHVMSATFDPSTILKARCMQKNGSV